MLVGGSGVSVGGSVGTGVFVGNGVAVGGIGVSVGGSAVGVGAGGSAQPKSKPIKINSQDIFRMIFLSFREDNEENRSGYQNLAHFQT